MGLNITKNYQNVNSKRLQLTTVYFFNTERPSCAIFDFDILHHGHAHTRITP
jgi:hypothetical protein